MDKFFEVYTASVLLLAKQDQQLDWFRVSNCRVRFGASVILSAAVSTCTLDILRFKHRRQATKFRGWGSTTANSELLEAGYDVATGS